MFNHAADYYDKFRPSYPRDIINTFINKANLSEGSKLLEIGAGSGKATELFINKGYEIVCIDPGADLVDMGNKRFDGENFRFITARFEEYESTPKSFDAIFSAQSFHWVPQPMGYEKCAFALKDKGFLALFWNMYITYDNEVDNELVAISNKYGGFADFLSSENCEKRIDSIATGIKNSGLFSSPSISRSLWQQSYTADDYFGFALTGNFFMQKSDAEKQAAHKELRQLARKHNGVIERPYLCVLYLAQKLI